MKHHLVPFFKRNQHTPLNFKYTLKYNKGIDKKVRKDVIDNTNNLIKILNQAFYEEVAKIKEQQHFYFKINYHTFFITKGSDEIQGFLSISIQWLGIISNIGGTVAFVIMLKKTLQSTFFKKIKKLPDELEAFEINNTPEKNDVISEIARTEERGKKNTKRPLGSGIFAVIIGLIYFAVFYYFELNKFKISTNAIRPELLLQVWLVFSSIVLGGWGFNRILNSDGRWIIGQDTIKLVLAFVGATIAIFSLLIRTST